MYRLFAVPLLAIAVVAVPARAQTLDSNDRWAPCLDSHPDTVIAGCTRLIETHVDSFADLGLAFYYRGNAYFSKGDYDRSIANYNEAIWRRPDYASAFNNRGNAYASKGDYDHSIADFTKAIHSKQTYGVGLYDPRPLNYAVAFNNRGIAYSNKHDYDRAIADFTESIRLNPSAPEAFDNRGSAYTIKRDFAHAIEDFSASLHLNPKDSNALYGRAIARQDSNDVSGASIDFAAAKQIDPQGAAKFAKLVTPDIAASAQALSPSTASTDHDEVSACEIPPDTMTASQSNHGAPMPSYIDDSIEQLKRELPAFAAIRFEAFREPANGTSTVTDQPASILARTGAVVAAQFQRMPNLIAKEKVQQPADASPDPDMTEMIRSAATFGSVANRQVNTTDRIRVFSYRLVPKESSTSGRTVGEYRLDEHNQPLSDSAHNAENPRSVGFGASWLLFLPANLQQSRFRYLGQQKIRGHQTYVLAFAQIPGRIRQGTIVETAGGRCSTLSQGVVWIDQSTYQIIHLQTDLLWPLPRIHVYQLRSVLNYSQVRIPQRNLSLWLPSDVETTWQTAYNAGDELHTYSSYRLFAATSRILRPDEMPSH